MMDTTRRNTTRIIYCKGNSYSNQYASRNCSGYGTKWKIYLRTNYYGEWAIVGIPTLMVANWDIDEKKAVDSHRELETMLGY